MMRVYFLFFFFLNNPPPPKISPLPPPAPLPTPGQGPHPRHRVGPHGRATIVAAMPGKIVRILVGVGEEVKAAQGVVVIEAMKMQNELKAPQDGRVTAINVKENDSVNAGTILATIE